MPQPSKAERAYRAWLLSFEFKPCSKCHRVLPLEQFSHNKNRHCGYCARCKDCARAYRKANAEAIKTRKRSYAKANAEAIKAHKQAYRNANAETIRGRRRAYREANAEAVKTARRTKYERNKGAVLAKQRAYQRAHPEKVAAQRAARYEARKDKERQIRRDYYARNKDKCKARVAAYRQTTKGHKLDNAANARRYQAKQSSGAMLTPRQWQECVRWFEDRCAYCGRETDLQQDHYIPLALDGAYAADNIVPACAHCNASKSAKVPSEWASAMALEHINDYFESMLGV